MLMAHTRSVAIHVRWGCRGGTVNEPRTAKSFRAAAARIFDQETSIAGGVTHLLSSGATAPRLIASDDDAWAVRLGSLSAMALWDAAALVTTSPVTLTRAVNVSARVVFDLPIASAVDQARRTAGAVQTAAATTLLDGRVSEAALVVPLSGIQGVDGYVVAFRVGRAFGAADARAAASASELAALEVHLASASRREAIASRQALALFELSRLCLFRDESEDALDAVVEVLSRSLDNDVAQLWTLRAGGSLRLRAARPHEGLDIQIARPRDHVALARALAGEIVRAHDPSLRSWMPRTTRDLIVAPLDSRDGPVGVLVLGRWRATYDAEEQAMAALCAGFIGRALALTDQRRRAPERDDSMQRTDAEDAEATREEPELTGS